MAIDYDPLDATPATKTDALSYYGSSSSAPWDDSCLSADDTVSLRRPSLYVRPGALAANQDLKTYDLANLFVMSSGFAGATACGELYVEYDIVLSTPQMESTIMSATLYCGAAGLTTNSLFGTAVTQSGLLDITVTSASTVTFNQDWQGLCTISLTGTVILNTAPTQTGTVTTEAGSVLPDTAATSARYIVQIKALRGQTFIPAISCTTLTLATCRFSEFEYGLL